MREIKFRAWDKTLNKWLNPDEVRMSMSGKLEVRTTGSLADFARHIELTQYTGLKDKNGKESYHKDIIKDFILGELWLVEWSDEYACFALQRITENTVKVKGILETISACRIVDLGGIIGNIYENPELLES